jgi:hypothetical protein
VIDMKTFETRVVAAIDQIAACVRQHDEEKHAGGPCAATRAACLAHLFHALRVNPTDVGFALLVGAFWMTLNDGKTLPIKDPTPEGGQ